MLPFFPALYKKEDCLYCTFRLNLANPPLTLPQAYSTTCASLSPHYLCPCAGAGAVAAQLLQWQLFHDLTHAPRVAALHSGGSGSILTVLDAHTGAALEEIRLPGRVDKVTRGWTRLCVWGQGSVCGGGGDAALGYVRGYIVVS
eukprot:907313-Pelagomonas_calceolata.AAC.1